MSQLLSLAYRCACGTRPNWRITPQERDRHHPDDPSAVVATWQCQNPRCRETHLIPARAYQEARPRSEAA